MATVNPGQSVRSRRWRRFLIVAVVVAAVLLAWNWRPLNAFATTGASYAARVGCSCHYVGGRDLADCRKDFEPGMELVFLSRDEAAKSVTARFPLLASQTAAYREGEGCRLEPWQE